MADTIEYEELEGNPGSGSAEAADLSRLSEIPMELSVEVGRSRMTVGETLQLAVGTVVALDREAGRPADLLVNGSAIARGEIVVIDEHYALRITEILDELPAAERAADSDAAVPEPAAEG